VNEYAGLFLGVMAVALAVMAAIQIGLIVVALRVARQLEESSRKALTAAAELQQEIRPLIQKAHVIADEATRITSLAAVQAERVDRFMASTTTRLDDTLRIIQNMMSGPVGQGAAAISAFRAAMSAVREWRGRRRQASEEDDALFVG
jgi:hypothetical protein